MKKIIGILGVAVIAMTMFVKTNASTSSDLGLESLMSLNDANAECPEGKYFNNGFCNLQDVCRGTPFPEDQNCGWTN